MEYALAILLVLSFSFISGFNDGGNVLATLVNTRTIRPFVAVLIIVSTLVLGPLLLGTAVATTIGTQIVNIQRVGIGVLDISLIATLVTLFIAWYVKIPTSTTFALVGGLLGSSMIRYGPSVIVWHGMVKVFLSLFLSVVLGGFVGFSLYFLIRQLFKRLSYQTSQRLLTVQYLSGILMSFGYGANDAEKAIGLLGVIWVLAHHGSTIHITLLMILLPSAAFAVGLLTGGWRIAKTVGFHVFPSRPIHAVSTQLATASVVMTASLLGGPVSSTQTIDSALVGVGVRASKERVKFQVVRKMAFVWILTMPLSFLVASSIAFLCKLGGWV